MVVSELDKFLAELRFMDIILPDVYDRIQIENHHIVGLNLDSVNLAHFTHFPISIVNMSSLRRLSLRFNHLDQIPEVIFEIDQLEVLDLSHNHLEFVPSQITSLTNLRELRLKANQIREFPLLPPQLERLHLGQNRIKQIPMLHEPLKSLVLANNEVSEINQLLPSTLSFFNLRSNRFEDIPGTIMESTLSKVNLYNNPIDWQAEPIPDFDGVIFTDHLNPEREDPYVVLYPQFRDLRFSRDHPPQFGVSYQGIPFTSIMVYGDDGVGKKTLIETYLHQHFIPDSHLYISQNRYLNWDHYVLRQQNIFYQIWYPFNQQSFDPTYRTSVLNGFYYSNAVILLFDLSKPETFKTVLKSILQIYEIRVQNCPVIVVGNKADLRNPDSHSSRQIRSYLDNLELKTHMDLLYHEISVNEREDILNVFRTLFQIISR